MPINQKRVIDLIIAGRDFQRAFLALEAQIADLWQRYKGKLVTAEDALRILASTGGEHLLDQPGKSEATLTAEYRHFKANARRNELAAQRQERRRRKKGAKTRIIHDPFAPSTPAPAIPAVMQDSLNEDPESRGSVLPTASTDEDFTEAQKLAGLAKLEDPVAKALTDKWLKKDETGEAEPLSGQSPDEQ